MNATKIVVTSVTKDSPGAGQVTIVGTYTADQDFAIQPQQITVNNYSEGNPRWSRWIRTSTEAIFVGRNGATAVALETEGLVQLAFTLEDDLTYAPRITTQPADDSCVASSTAADFTVVSESESTSTKQWQYETKAAQTLTSDETNVSDTDTVVVGGVTYTFKTALTPTAGEVLIGADADASLLNLIRAINHTGTPGTDYANLGSTAIANPQVKADASVTAHAFAVYALTSGTAGNSIASTETSTHLSWGAATLTGGGTWNSASGTVRGCAFSNGTTGTLTATPTTTIMSGTEIRCQVTNATGSTNSDAVTLTIT